MVSNPSLAVHQPPSTPQPSNKLLQYPRICYSGNERQASNILFGRTTFLRGEDKQDVAEQKVWREEWKRERMGE